MLARLDFGNVCIDYRVVWFFYPLFEQNSLVNIENGTIMSKKKTSLMIMDVKYSWMML
jgi:hypothetical protein